MEGAYLPGRHEVSGCARNFGHDFVLHGSIDDAAACQTALNKRMVNPYGRTPFDPLAQTSKRRNRTHYSALPIKQQQTPMGQLFFAPFDHSQRTAVVFAASQSWLATCWCTSCVTRSIYLNHSARFWRSVESYLPDYRQFDRQLRNGDRCMSGWLTSSCAGKARELGVGKQAN
jgi:hypothetical protein